MLRSPRAQSVPPPKAGQQPKGSPQKKGDKGAGKSTEGKAQPKSAAPSKPSSPPATNPPPPKAGGGRNPNRPEKRMPGTIKKQSVPYTLADGCVNGNNCPFQHANDPTTKKPLAPSPEDVKRYQAALKRNPSLANPKPASSGANKSSRTVPTIKMIRLETSEESEEEPEPEQFAQVTEPPLIGQDLREIIQTQRGQLIWMNLHIKFLNQVLSVPGKRGYEICYVA